MALTSTFYDGYVTETDRAKNLAGTPEYGVYGPADFKVTAHPSIPYAVLVKAGRAHGHGVTDTAAEDQVVQCATLASGTRWDLIVVRRNWQPALGGPSTLEAIQAGSTPVIPAARKVGPGVEDDQPLFLVKWQGGTSAPVELRDLRVWAANGGLYAKDDLVRNYLEEVGTIVNIAGTEWRYVLGANDVPAWTGGTTTVNVSLTGTGWSNQASTLPLRVEKRNGIGFLNGYVYRSTGTNDTVGVIPAGSRPLRDVTFSTTSQNGEQNGADAVGPEFRIYLDASTGSIIVNRYGVEAPVWANVTTKIPISASFPLA